MSDTRVNNFKKPKTMVDPRRVNPKVGDAKHHEYLGVDEEGHVLRKGTLGTVRKLSSNPKQIRARARRAGAIQKGELEVLYKPVEEWDVEELARGYPRDKNGRFCYRPSWVNQEVHEQIVSRFRQIVKQEMHSATVPALNVLTTAMEHTGVDNRGKPIVPWSVKVDIAKFLIEHIVGKPKQTLEADISVKLQGILAHALVVPGDPNSAMAQGFMTLGQGDEDDVIDSEDSEDDDE